MGGGVFPDHGGLPQPEVSLISSARGKGRPQRSGGKEEKARRAPHLPQQNVVEKSQRGALRPGVAGNVANEVTAAPENIRKKEREKKPVCS